MILECYLGAFADACKRAGGWYGLDLFAGVGLNWSLLREREMHGSPLIALNAEAPLAEEVMLCESDRRARVALTARCAPHRQRAQIFPGDANVEIGPMLERVPPRAPAFAFLDPEGAELSWTTVRAIARHKHPTSTRVEQLILLPTDMGFVRLLDRGQTNEAGAQMVARMFGNEDWRDVWDARARGEISADEARGEYVRLYGAGLRRLGYATVLDRQIRRQNGAPMYFLLFATDHPAGEKIMDHCFDQVRARRMDELAQSQLFETPEPPRRRRL